MTTTICKINELQEGVEIKLRVNGKIEYKIFPFRNYFYIREEDFEDVAHIIAKKAFKYEVVEDRNGHEYVKIFLKNNYHRGFLRKELEEEGVITYEADINAPKRLLLDNQNLPLNQNGLKIAWYDIETMDVLPFQKDFDGNIVPVHPILSIAVKEKGEDFVWYDYNRAIDNPILKPYKELRMQYLENPTIENHKKLEEWNPTLMPLLEAGEKELLEKFLAYVVKFDVLSAFNGSGFDDNYIRYRSKLYGIDSDKTTNNVNFDYMLVYKKNVFEPRTSYSLNNLSLVELQSELDNPNSTLSNPEEIQKIDWREKTNATRFFDMYVCYPDLLKEYNIQDCLLLEMLESKLNLFKLHFVETKISHCLLIDTLYNSRICDMMTLNKYKKRGIIKISKPNDDEAKERENQVPSGGFVLANTGYYDDVKVFDFASLYPTIGITFNISPETYVRTVYADLNKVFSKIEIEYIYYANKISKNFKDAKGKLNKKKYLKDLEQKRYEIECAMTFDTDEKPTNYKFPTIDELMWKFVEEYDQKIEVGENVCYTPADLNMDSSGFNVHPHYVFKNDEVGVYSELYKELLIERNKVKYSLEEIEDKNSFEYQEKFVYQWALKILANSLYGFSAFRKSRDFRIELPNAITTSGRFLIKKSSLEAQKKGYTIRLVDTDSTNGNLPKGMSLFEFDLFFQKLFDDYIKRFNANADYPHIDLEIKEKLKEEGLDEETKKELKGKLIINKSHALNLEYEATYDKLIVVAKKRYYFLKKGKIGGKGGFNIRSDVLKIAKDFQLELLEDIFHDKFDKDVWLKKLNDMKDKVFSFNLEEEHIIRTQGLSKPVDDYGKPVINSSTGEQKVRKSDGQPMFAPIPANVQIAKKLMAQGVNVNVSDKINFIVVESKPKIKPITIEEYRENKTYCANYYYTKIITPILEILMVVYPDLVYNHFSSCWKMTKRQLENARNKMQEEDSDEE